MNANAPIDVCIAYSQKDKALLDRLVIQLRAVERIGLVDSWHDGEIQAGSNREEAILQAMHRAEIILLLISADFLASDFSYEKEIKVAKMLHQKSALMIPVILKDCSWEAIFPDHEFVLPRNHIPINNSHWQSPDRAFQKVVDAVIHFSKQFRAGVPIPHIQTTVKETETIHHEKTITVSKTTEEKPQKTSSGNQSIWKYLSIALILLTLAWFLFPALSSTKEDSNRDQIAKEKPYQPNKDITSSNEQSSKETVAKPPVETIKEPETSTRVNLPAIRIGQLDWMSQNLNRPVAKDSWCPNEKEADCAKYGRYYTFKSALQACPNGWRLPTRAEWAALKTSDLQKLNLPQSGFYNKATTQLGMVGNYWSGDRANGGQVWCLRFKEINKSRVDRFYAHFGLPCRCVADVQ